MGFGDGKTLQGREQDAAEKDKGTRREQGGQAASRESRETTARPCGRQSKQ